MKFFNSIQSALFASFLVIVFLMSVIFAWVSLPAIEKYEANQIGRELITQAQLASGQLKPKLEGKTKPHELQSLLLVLSKNSKSRVTLIGSDGTVIGDSSTPENKLMKLENHAGRPEIVLAKSKGQGQAIRYSATLKKNLIYSAIRLSGSKGQTLGYLRFSAPSGYADSLALQIYWAIMAAFLLAILGAILAGLWFTRFFTVPIIRLSEMAKRISSGDYRKNTLRRSGFEIGDLERSLEEMSLKISKNLDKYSEEKGKLRAILSSAAEGILAVDRQGKLVFANPVAEKIFGIIEPEVIGKSLREAVRNNEICALIEKVMESGERADREIDTVVPVEGSFAVQASPVKDAAGRNGVVCVIFDITKMKKLENYRSEFVANVSHELKTPLTVIRNYVETLLGGAIDDQANSRSFLEKINRSAANLANLIDDILEISRMESRRQLGAFTEVDLAKVCDHALETVEIKANKKGVKIKKELPETKLIVKGLEEHLYRAVLNLLDNAVNYTEAGKIVTLSVKTMPAGSSFPQVMIEVADEGIGIPDEHLPRIFERFYRVDPARSRELGGTGLGLAIVKHVAELHGGRVEVKSAVGKGSLFIIELPLFNG